MGFWQGLADGQDTLSDEIISALMRAQQSGEPNPFPGRVLKNVNEFPDLPEGRYKGHAAWNQWPWKLHRIERGGVVALELYHLIDDPMEAHDLSTSEPGRTAAMRTDLEAWQASVFESLEGKDYPLEK